MGYRRYVSCGLFVVGLLLGVSRAEASVDNYLSWNPTVLGPIAITNGGGATLNGWVANDLILHTTADWTATAMLISLSSGSIFQEPEGFGLNGVTLGQPDPGGFGPLPSSEFDTYIFDPHGGAAIAGAAGDVGGDVQQFDTNELDISWNSAGADTNDIGKFRIARVTLSPDASGYASIAFTVAGVPGQIRHYQPIVNGILFPEPASFALMGLASLACLGVGYNRVP